MCDEISLISLWKGPVFLISHNRKHALVIIDFIVSQMCCYGYHMQVSCLAGSTTMRQLDKLVTIKLMSCWNKNSTSDFFKFVILFLSSKNTYAEVIYKTDENMYY